MVGTLRRQALLRPHNFSTNKKPLPFSIFKTKLELQISGLGCGYLPRYLAQRFLDSGALIEKKVVAQTLFEPVWIGWNEQTAGFASGWWRDEILANSAIAGVYAKSDDGKSAI